ncbi:EAL domain-containing protein [Kiloniella antarctica]|uniref:EAL domain-containing protein n=1 Tax=Kiloniella antarctica TaxID=1550907 RepID=A0ABW5BHG2_9PROT
MQEDISDKLLFADDLDEIETTDKPEDVRTVGDPEFWEVLIVDDEEDIHTLTSMMLSDITFAGRKLKFHSTYSAQEAKNYLLKYPDTALILLNVMMENDDVGIELVSTIRNEFNNDKVQIVLRTGQSGQAPDRDMIYNYNINGYYFKTEITSQKLFSILISSLRTYSLIDRLEKNSNGLTKIINASEDMMKSPSVRLFCSGVLTQFATILKCSANGIICSETPKPAFKHNSKINIIAAVGSFVHTTGESLDTVDESLLAQLVRKTLKEKQHQFQPTSVCLYVRSQNKNEMAIYLDLGHPLNDHDRQLIEIFCSRISLLHENLQLFTNIRRTVYYDTLTDLPNRASFIERLGSFLDFTPSEKTINLAPVSNGNEGTFLNNKASKTDKGVAILLLGLDKFRDINHSFSHKIGDDVLKEVARRLQKGATNWPLNNIQISRVGGDTFGVLSRIDEGPCAAKKLADLVLSVLEAPFKLDDLNLRITGSIGTVISKDSDRSNKAEDLLHHADIAMAQAKEFGRNSVKSYDETYGQDLIRRTQTLQNLRAALSRKEFSLNYQPQIDAFTGQIVGTEALLRWQNRNGEWIPPDQFIPLAEQAGLIGPIGQWVLEQAIRTQRKWLDAGISPMRMAVNISAVQLADPELPAHIKDYLNNSGLDPRYLEIEVTETAIMSEPAIALETLGQLKEMGVDISIDDFGTGTTSMSQLKSIPAQKLKIDRSFIASALTDARDAAITKSIIQLGNAFNMKVIAEGVELKEQEIFLQKEGCHILQGYYYAKPMPEDQMLVFLQEYSSE